MMNVREFGQEGGKVIVLIHPSLVTWDYFRDVIPLLEDDYRVVVPVLPGTDLDNDSEFTSVEQIASELAYYLVGRGMQDIHAIYGCSMGGSIVLRMAADGRLNVGHYIMDGGITPYQLPWILTRPIALRDFCVVYSGKLVGERLMVKAFTSTEFSEEDIRYLANMLRHCTAKTIWRTFDSCNNYAMPKEVMHFDGTMHYWYASGERKARDWDIKYMRKFVPETVFEELEGIDHGDLALFHADRMADELKALDAGARRA